MSASRTAGGAVTFAGASTVSMGASFNSDPIKLNTAEVYSVQSQFTGGGSPTGTLKLQCSNDEGVDGGVGLVTGLSLWSDITGSSQAITASGDHTWNAVTAGYKWARIVYTRTSGTDTYSARLYVKGA